MRIKKPWFKQKRILAAIGSGVTILAYCINNDFVTAARILSGLLGGE